MSIVYHRGDIFTTDQPAIAHGVNTEGFMESGLAAKVRETFPASYVKYRDACENGTLKPGGICSVNISTNRWILHLASQREQGPNAKMEYLESSVRKALQFCVNNRVSGVAFPLIGSGIGGLTTKDSVRALESIAQEFPDLNIEIWFYNGVDDERNHDFTSR